MSDWYIGTVEDAKYLKMYGVLGMRWGVRKNKEYKNTIRSSKQRLKRDVRKANGNKELIKSAKEAHKNRLLESRKKVARKIYAGTDERVLDKTVSEKMSKALVKSYLMGSYGSIKYNEVRATKNYARGTAFIHGTGASMENRLNFGLSSVSDGHFAKREEYKEVNRLFY